ncbi:leucine-rich repeat flightless-interacting protein 1-like [Carcharodon carcharias]|uniref:leucine-rich repeat flightless-interacting protein 1-like n=1 Tax=Carcharodon carcharias TaxID=13397 RepID=UPI001B7E2B29|nr:leucine-rich repeat flightless-interacting protein 1-like [Carcharodon carcharias]
MGTPANSRRRFLSREMSEDENMMMIIQEADAKSKAKKASFAEAKEACAKKLVRQQQEDIQEDLEEKYMDAVQSIDHLETEKTLLVYEVEQLRDILESTEEELAELHRKHTQMHRELETEKVAKHLLQQKINFMEKQLEERKKSQDTEIAATKNMDKDIQSNFKYQGNSDAKKIEFKSDEVGKHSMEQFQDSVATLQDAEVKHSANGSFETKSNRLQKTKTIGDISNGKYQEGSMNIFTQQGAADTCVEESTGLIEDNENITVVEKMNSIHHYATEREGSNIVMEGHRSEALEQLELGSGKKDTEYKECKEREQNKLILEVNEVTSGETVHKKEMNEKKSEGNEPGTREEVSNEECLSNRMEGGVRKQVEEKEIMMEMCGGKNLGMVKEKPVEVWGSMSEALKQVGLAQDHKMTTGKSSWEGTIEKNREIAASEISYKKMEMDNKAEEIECGGEELAGGIESAQDKWPESGREGGEIIEQFQCMTGAVSDLVKGEDSVNLKRDVWLDEAEQHEGMHGKEVFVDEVQSQRGEEELEYENPVKNEEMDQQLQVFINKVNEGEDSRAREGENVTKTVDTRKDPSHGSNKEWKETNANLDMSEQETVIDGQAHIEGKETQNEGRQNTGGKEKGALDMLGQLFKNIITQQKSFSDCEGKVNSDDYVDGQRSETDGEREDEIKEQDEEYVLAKQGQHRKKENKGIESTGGEIEEKTNDELCRKGLVDGRLELTVPEGNKATTELVEEAERAVADLSDDEMHDAAESIASEPKTDTHIQENKPKTEEDPESTTTKDDVELRENLSTIESTKQHIKHRDTCRVS